MSHPLYLPVSSLLSNSQQKKIPGVENMLLAGKLPPIDYNALYLLKAIDYELQRIKTMSSPWAQVPLHKTAFIYIAIKKKKKRGVRYRNRIRV